MRLHPQSVPPEQGSGGASGGPGGRLNLLLSYAGWDDDPWVDRLPKLLDPMGVRSVRAHSAREAARVIASTPIHIAVVDLGLPLEAAVGGSGAGAGTGPGTGPGGGTGAGLGAMGSGGIGGTGGLSPAAGPTGTGPMGTGPGVSGGVGSVASRGGAEAGPQVLTLLARLSSPPPTVVVKRRRTSRDDQREIAAALRAGAFAVLDRPRESRDLELLLEVLRRLLHRHYAGRWPTG